MLQHGLAANGSLPVIAKGTESFSLRLANNEASQEVLVSYGSYLANNTCPEIEPLINSTKGIPYPPSGISAVCAYATTDSGRAKLLACGLIQLPSGFQMMIGNCSWNDMDWGDSGANVIAILGSDGSVIVSGSKRISTNTPELTWTVEESKTDTISPSPLASYTKSFPPSKTYTPTLSLQLTPSKSHPFSFSRTLSQTFTHDLPTPAPTPRPTPVPPPPLTPIPPPCACLCTGGGACGWGCNNVGGHGQYCQGCSVATPC